MKEIFEKIIIDSIGSLADGVVNELHSRRNGAKESGIKREIIKYNDDKFDDKFETQSDEKYNGDNYQNLCTKNETIAADYPQKPQGGYFQWNQQYNPVKSM